MAQVIEWVSPGEKDIVWKYPNETIGWGSQLVVKEFEAAVFLRDGKAYDVFGPGRHTITTMNVPLLKGLIKGVMGYDKSPFRATVIFVSLRRFNGQFGGKGMSKELAPINYFGSFWFKIKDPNLFVNEVIGGRNVFETKDLNNFMRGYFNESFMKKIGQMSVFDIMAGLEKMSLETKVFLQDDFGNLGVELVEVKFEGLDTTDEWKDRLYWVKQMGPKASGYVLQMETLKDVSKELGKSNGAALGAGMVMVPGLMGQPPVAGGGGAAGVTGTAQPQQPQKTAETMECPSCHKKITKNSKFCPHCGFKLVKTCPNGHEVSTDAKFCPQCGASLVKKCPNGHEVPLDAIFCPLCGTKMENR